MKLKVEKQFRDKHTGVLYKVGNVIEVNDGRGKELLNDSRALVTQVKEETKKAEKPKATSKAKSKKSEK